MPTSSLTTAETRIRIHKRTARWSDEPVTAADALDFWSFAAGAANVIMQLSLPGVGYGVVESRVDSGNLLIHPWKRARTTFTYIAVAIIGSDEDKLLYREAVNSAHRHVQSTDQSPVRYNAFDRDLQMWVAACLFVGLEDTYQLLRGEMTADQAEGFYRSAWTLGTTLQVSEDQWPPTRAAFDDYWNTACQRVQFDDTVRAYLFDLIDLEMINRCCAYLSWSAQIPHRRIPGAGIPRRTRPCVERAKATPLRTAVSLRRPGEPLPALVPPSAWPAPAAGRPAPARPPRQATGLAASRSAELWSQYRTQRR